MKINEKELFEENDYFDTFRNNQATISYDEENEDILLPEESFVLSEAELQ